MGRRFCDHGERLTETERTALIDELVRLIEPLAEKTQQQTETIQQLRNEIATLKGEKGKPRFKPSGMEQKAGQGDEQQGDEDPSKGTRKRPGSSKRAKTAQLKIHEDRRIPPSQPPPPGSRFKGYRDVLVQDLKIEAHKTPATGLRSGKPRMASGSAVSCRALCRADTSAPACAPTRSTSTITVMSPSRCCVSSCWNGASTSRWGRSTPCSVDTTKRSLPSQTLKRLHRNQSELLLVLLRPDIPLHTNGSENDIRGDVKWRKISGGTRSDLGRRCRDTFASLKKTCRKLNISFWDNLNDRIK